MWMVICKEFSLEFTESPIYYRSAHTPCELLKEPQIVQRQQSQPEYLIRANEMPYICSSIPITAGIASTAFLKCVEIMRIYRILHYKATIPCHGHAITCNSRRIYTVKHVYAT